MKSPICVLPILILKIFLKSPWNRLIFTRFWRKIRPKKLSLKVCDIKWRVMQSEWVSKKRYCLRHCLVKQRTVCIINVWGYTEILPNNFARGLKFRGLSFRSLKFRGLSFRGLRSEVWGLKFRGLNFRDTRYIHGKSFSKEYKMIKDQLIIPN